MSTPRAQTTRMLAQAGREGFEVSFGKTRASDRDFGRERDLHAAPQLPSDSLLAMDPVLLRP